MTEELCRLDRMQLQKLVQYAVDSDPARFLPMVFHYISESTPYSCSLQRCSLCAVFQKSNDIFIFNNSVKKEPILIISGIQNPDKIWHKQLWLCPHTCKM